MAAKHGPGSGNSSHAVGALSHEGLQEDAAPAINMERNNVKRFIKVVFNAQDRNARCTLEAARRNQLILTSFNT